MPLSRDLGHLKTLLIWEGELTNERIRDFLGVQKVQASRLLGELVRHVGPRGHRPTPYAPLEFRGGPADPLQSPDDYLQVLTGGPAAAGDEIVDARQNLGVVPTQVFASSLQAIRRQVGLQIVYRSMSHPEGRERMVFPHALVRAPRRWHLRAWCAVREGFRDFALGRIAHAEIAPELAPHGATDDDAWQKQVDLVIVAHTALSLPQQRMIAHEYFPGSRAMRLRIRECLTPYVVQDLRLAVDADRQKPPDYQLLVSNAAKVPTLSFRTGDPN